MLSLIHDMHDLQIPSFFVITMIYCLFAIKKCFCLLDNTKINNDNMSVILIVNVEITSMAFQRIRYNYAMYTEYALMFSLDDENNSSCHFNFYYEIISNYTKTIE